MERFLLRMPPELKARLEREAGAAGMSLNSLIVERLSGEMIQVVEQPELVDGAGRPVAVDADPIQPAPRGKRSTKLDPSCRNAQYHWKVEPGNVCSFCGGSR